MQKKKMLVYVMKGLFQFKRKNSVIGLGEFNNLFFSVFPGTPGLSNKSIIYSKTVIRYVQNLHNKIISLLVTSWQEDSIYIRRG